MHPNEVHLGRAELDGGVVGIEADTVHLTIRVLDLEDRVTLTEVVHHAHQSDDVVVGVLRVRGDVEASVERLVCLSDYTQLALYFPLESWGPKPPAAT